jgi:hypothetical protein
MSKQKGRITVPSYGTRAAMAVAAFDLAGVDPLTQSAEDALAMLRTLPPEHRGYKLASKRLTPRQADYFERCWQGRQKFVRRLETDGLRPGRYYP